MQIEMMLSKIHRATVTDANLNYVGSITIDTDLMKKANLRENQKVDVVDINNGERLSTYVIPGPAGKGDICLNGAAARKVAIGDKVIIIAYAYMVRKKQINTNPPLSRWMPTTTLLRNKTSLPLREKAPLVGFISKTSVKQYRRFLFDAQLDFLFTHKYAKLIARKGKING